MYSEYRVRLARLFISLLVSQALAFGVDRLVTYVVSAYEHPPTRRLLPLQQ